MIENILKRGFMVKPSECNAKGELPLPMLVSQMIDLATDHANLLGIGFLALEPKGLGWVLSRLSVEISRWPRNGEKYELSTWIESYNAHFSERCFSLVTESGEVLAYGRTVWVIIDLNNHKSVGTAGTVMPDEMLPGISCPIPKYLRHKSFTPQSTSEYVFKYSDIDFYRHVNTVKYISLLINQFSLEELDRSIISRFDIAFAHEAKYGEKALINEMCEEVENPSLQPSTKKSVRHSFEISVGNTDILYSNLTLTSDKVALS